MYTTLISVSDLAGLPDDVLRFDCRHQLGDPAAGRRAYAAGHLPGAYHLHLDADLSGEIVPGRTGRHPLPAAADFARLMGRYGLLATTQVVCYDDVGGGIAARAWWMLRALGHDAVAVLDGGLPAWTAAGYPLEEGETTYPRPYADPPDHLCSTNFPGTCARARVSTVADDADQRLVDSRTAPRYRGEHEPIDPVAGHIPGAVNLPWPDNLTEGHMKPPEVLRARFAGLAASAAHNVFYCGSGVTACHNILAYAHAFGDLPRLYAGSWSEWITDQEN